jgi:hypothetical protein
VNKTLYDIIFSTINPIKNKRKVKVLCIVFWKVLKLHLFVCPFGKSNVWIKMSMKHWWIVVDKGKLKY